MDYDDMENVLYIDNILEKKELQGNSFTKH